MTVHGQLWYFMVDQGSSWLIMVNNGFGHVSSNTCSIMTLGMIGFRRIPCSQLRFVVSCFKLVDLIIEQFEEVFLDWECRRLASTIDQRHFGDVQVAKLAQTPGYLPGKSITKICIRNTNVIWRTTGGCVF